MENESVNSENRNKFNIPYTIFNFKIKALEPLELPPFKGSTLRGGFGTAFKKSICVTRKRVCDDCILKDHCIYSYVFETPVSENSGIYLSSKDAPHPFIFNPPLDEKTNYEKGEELNFDLVLIGKAIKYLPYFIWAFVVFGENGIGKDRRKFTLTMVKKGRRIVYKDGKLKPGWESVQKIKRKSLNNSKKIQLKFLTPTKIISSGKIVRTPAFSDIIKALERRLFLLEYFHSETIPERKKYLIEQSYGIKTIKSEIIDNPVRRYSSRQKKKLKMDGFTGKIIYAGNFEPFGEILKLGEIFHIGKATSFGFGRYEIEEV